MFILDTVSCTLGGGTPVTMDPAIPNIITTIVNLIKVVVPILLIIFGMLDMGKAVMAQKEDEIKKGQQTLIKRAIAAAIVFFVIIIVQLVVGLVAPDDKDSILNCIDCMIDYSKDNANCNYKSN